MRYLGIIAWLIFAVITGGVADGLNDSGCLVWGHLAEALEVGVLLMTPFVLNIRRKEWYLIFIAYICFRIGFFDYSYNLTRGLPFFYIGESSLWDNFFSKFPAHGVTWFRAVFLIVGVSIPIKYL